MMTLGLTPAELDEYRALLASHHWIDVRLDIMDLDHNHTANISSMLLDGQVTVDAAATITRGLSVDLIDPTYSLHLDTNSPSDGALFADQMLRATYTVLNPDRTMAYPAAVFTGPIVGLERDGAIVQLECQGKEVFGLVPAWREKTFKKGVKVTFAIRTILKDIMGESKIVIPNLRQRLPRNYSVGGDNLPWTVAKKMAASMGYHLYFDGYGVCRMRKMPNRPCFAFAEGRNVITEPQVGFSIENTKNAVEVVGKVPKKGKPPSARATAKRRHPLSPWSLGRTGGPRFLVATYQDDSIRTKKQAKKRAKYLLRRLLKEAIEVKYDALVAPHLEEMDVVRINTSKYATNHRLKAFAIPLTSAGHSSIGYVKNVKMSSRSARLRRKTRASARKGALV